MCLCPLMRGIKTNEKSFTYLFFKILNFQSKIENSQSQIRSIAEAGPLCASQLWYILLNWTDGISFFSEELIINEVFTYCNSHSCTKTVLINFNEYLWKQCASQLSFTFVSPISLSRKLACSCGTETYVDMLQNAVTELYRQATRQHTPPKAHWDTWNRALWAPSQGSGHSIQAGQSGWPCPAGFSPDWEARKNVEHQIPAGSEANGLPAGSWRGRLMPNTAWADRKGQGEEGESRQEAEDRHNIDS